LVADAQQQGLVGNIGKHRALIATDKVAQPLGVIVCKLRQEGTLAGARFRG
jgi:hypothetical protein